MGVKPKHITGASIDACHLKICSRPLIRIIMDKTLHNSTASDAKKNVSDIQFYGDGDTFELISKASSADEGWMKSTKAMQIDGVGCVIQVTTQQGENIAEALTFVAGVKIELIDGDKENGRRIVSI